MKMKRISCLLIALTIILPMFNLNVYADKVFTEDMICEAELASVKGGMKYVNSEYASGGKYLMSAETNITDAANIKESDISFMFSVPVSGKYCVYVRAYFPSTSTDSFYFRWDEGQWTQKVGTVAHDFAWVKLDDVQLDKGRHRFRIAHAEAGSWFDAAYITTDTSKAPPEEIDGVKPMPEAQKSQLTYVHTQKEPLMVTGDGAVMEETDASYSAEYFDVISPQGASGGSALMAHGRNGTIHGTQFPIPQSGDPGAIRVAFTVDKTSDYTVWLRLHYVSSMSNASWYAQIGDGKVHAVFPGTSNSDFVWVNIGRCKVKAGETAYANWWPRGQQIRADQILITPHSYYNPPAGAVDEVIASEIPLVNEYATPPITPPANEHPRLLFRAGDVEQLRQNLESEKMELVRADFMALVESNPEIPEAWGDPARAVMNAAEAKAYYYALYGDKRMGKQAIELAKTMTWDVSSVYDYSRPAGEIIKIIGQVYDWCYDLISDEDKAILRKVAIGQAGIMEIGWPPNLQGEFAGHACEAQLLRDLLSFAVATYDERPDIWEYVGGRFYEEYVPARQWYLTMQIHNQGNNYGDYRHMWDSYAYLIITGMGAPEPYDGKDLVMQSFADQMYLSRPSGYHFPYGDTYLDRMSYERRANLTTLVDAAISGDPYLYDELDRTSRMVEKEKIIHQYGIANTASKVEWLIFYDPTVEPRNKDEQPLSIFFNGGVSVARTGWDDGVDSNDAIAFLNMFEYYFANHQHKDAGAFQIYYKGPLASDSGFYPTYGGAYMQNYAWQSIAHNVMLVNDPNDTEWQWRGNVEYDGGQKDVDDPLSIEDMKENSQVADVLAHEIDPSNTRKPAYTYMKGDLSLAYTAKVKDYNRSFMFLNLDDEEVPAALIVFDRITSSNPSFKKTWLLHGQTYPEIKGNRTIWGSDEYQSGLYTYDGQMTVDTLLPKDNNTKIEIHNGPEEGWANVNGTNYLTGNAAHDTDGSFEENTYRMELSPKNASATDHFLNVIQVTDKNVDAYRNVQMIDTAEYYGAVIADRVVTFSKSGQDVSTAFEISASQNGAMQYTICDVKAGNWKVTAEDGTTQVIKSTEEGKLLSFTASGKSVKVEPTTEEAPEVVDEAEPLPETHEKAIHITLNNNYLYTDAEPELVNGKLMAPVANLAKAVNATVSKDFITTTIYCEERETTASVKVTSDTISSNKGDIKMENATYMKDGVLMIELRAFAELFGHTVTWDSITKTAMLLPTKLNVIANAPGYAKIIKAVPDGGAVDAANVIGNSIDGKVSNYWAVAGTDRYGTYEFDKKVILENVEIVFNPNNGRTPFFEIQVSDDGTNFTTVYEGTGDTGADGENWEVFKFDQTKLVEGKFVRYIGHGSNISNWNAVKEIRFKLGSELIKWENDENYAKVKEVEGDGGPIVEEIHIPINLIDGINRTLWVTDGRDRYVTFTLEEETELSAIEVAFNPSGRRNAMFEVQVSTDGENFTSVYKGTANGQIADNTWEVFKFDAPAKAKYVRYIGKGSNMSVRNGVREIRFKK